MPFKRKPQEKASLHGYYFSGQAVITQNAKATITQAELNHILTDLFNFIGSRPKGIDYLQVYQHEDGRRIWIIDNVSQQMRESNDYDPKVLEESDYWTILLPEDY